MNAILKGLPRITGVLAVLVLSACTTVPDDLGRSDVDALAEQRGRFSSAEATVASRDELLNQLTSAPLGPAEAVRITLLNNANLQASYARLGFGAADVYEAGRIRNPVIAASLLKPDVASEMNQLTLGLAASFTDLLTMSSRKRLSTAAFAALQAEIGADIMLTSAETESAWYGYAGAQQVEALRQQLALAAHLSAQLAERYFEAGNISARELALERAAASEARIAALDASTETQAARTRLALLLGLSSGDAWTVPGELNLPLAQEDPLQELLKLAEASRLDLVAARAEADLLADQLGVVNWTRWLGELEVGVERERETDGTRLTGPSLAWEIPVFTQNRDQQLRAEAGLKMAVAEVQALQNAVDNNVRQAHANVQNARERVAEYREVLIPQRVETVARAQEELNFMLIGTFELLAIKQQEYSTYQDYLEAVRDYWLARTELAMAVGSTLPSSQASTYLPIKTSELLQANPDLGTHSGHGGGSTTQPVMDHSKMDHQGMDHESMDHESMGHESPDLENTDQENTGHENMNHGDHSQHDQGEPK
jgi:cobalt-zinc-cadmium efflux system outer membrane protein